MAVAGDCAGAFDPLNDGFALDLGALGALPEASPFRTCARVDGVARGSLTDAHVLASTVWLGVLSLTDVASVDDVAR